MLPAARDHLNDALTTASRPLPREAQEEAKDRADYIDEGAMTPDSFAVHYQQRGPWWDDPPSRHGDGTTVSWADGHASHLKWKAPETIKRAKETQDWYGGGGFMPQTPEGIGELVDFQKAVWGRVGFSY